MMVRYEIQYSPNTTRSDSTYLPLSVDTEVLRRKQMRSASETHCCRVFLPFDFPLLLRELAASNGWCHLLEGGPRRSTCFEKGLPASMALWGRSRKSGRDGHQNFAVKNIGITYRG
jgi:hypothetical protein